MSKFKNKEFWRGILISVSMVIFMSLFMSLFMYLIAVGVHGFDAKTWATDWGYAFCLAFVLSSILRVIIPPLWIKFFKKQDKKMNKAEETEILEEVLI